MRKVTPNKETDEDYVFTVRISKLTGLTQPPSAKPIPELLD